MTSPATLRPVPLVVVVSLLGLLAGGCSDEPPPPAEVVRPVKAVKIADYAGFFERSFPGKATATREVDLAFDVAGTLVERPVDIGDALRAGALVAKVDQRDFLARVKAAEAELNKAAANFERAEKLIEQDFISKTEYDRLEAAKEVAESALLVARKALGDSVLKAPFDGVITNLYVENFQAVRPKQPVARLLDNSRIELVVSIPEQYISLVPQVRDLRVRFEAFKEIEIPAQVKEIGKEASAATRTYPVTLIMDQPDGVEILPGMAGVARGSAEIPAAQGSQRLIVPVTAVFSPEATEQSYVWVIDEAAMTVARRPVEVAGLNDTGVTIAEGLQPGEWIAVAGVHYLAEGQKVRMLDPQGD
jgi:RND family efflux transporter MFP subunit